MTEPQTEDWFSKKGAQRTVVRATKTAIQTFVAALVAAGSRYVDVATVKAGVFAAGAAALSAISNSIGTPAE